MEEKEKVVQDDIGGGERWCRDKEEEDKSGMGRKMKRRKVVWGDEGK